jgi:tRNA(Arg) A34 adenosine deaminase TadA
MVADRLSPTDEGYLRRAIELAMRARDQGEEPFGSLLVSAGGEVLVEDWNTMSSEGDITAHPELKLARWAGRELTAEVARKTTMYTSCQPCIMCVGAIERSGLGRVVFALSTEQFYELEPAQTAVRDAMQVDYEGPALLEEARVPIDGHYV